MQCRCRVSNFPSNRTRRHCTTNRPAKAYGLKKFNEVSSANIFYSKNKRDVKAEDVAMLLHAAREDWMGEGSDMKTSLFWHWHPDQGTSQLVIDKLSSAIDRSLAIVAAFTQADVYSSTPPTCSNTGPGPQSGSRTDPASCPAGTHPTSQSNSMLTWTLLPHPDTTDSSTSTHNASSSHSAQHSPLQPHLHTAPQQHPEPPCHQQQQQQHEQQLYGQQQQGAPGEAATSSTVGSFTAGPHGAPAAPAWARRPLHVAAGGGARRPVLIGFVRAGGDAALAASIQDLAVHPAFRHRGVGHSLLRALVVQLCDRGIYDIGAIVPAERRKLFLSDHFENDREGSATMMFAGHRAWMSGGQALPQVPGLMSDQVWLLDPDHTSSTGTPRGCKGGVDVLAAAPAPHTDALQHSAKLRGLLEGEMEAHLGPAQPVSHTQQTQPLQQPQPLWDVEGGVRGAVETPAASTVAAVVAAMAALIAQPASLCATAAAVAGGDKRSAGAMQTAGVCLGAGGFGTGGDGCMRELAGVGGVHRGVTPYGFGEGVPGIRRGRVGGAGEEAARKLYSQGAGAAPEYQI